MKKRRLVLIGFSAIVIVATSAAIAHAQQSRVTIDAGYMLGDTPDTFHYPKKQGLTSGKSYDTEGFSVTTQMRLTNVVSVSYRRERGTLSNATFFQRDRFDNKYVETDQEYVGGTTNYRELAGVFAMPRGYSLLIGVAENSTRHHLQYEMPTYPNSDYGPSSDQMQIVDVALEARHIGLVIGGSGQHRFHKLDVNYAGRWFPRLRRTDEYATSNYSDEGDNKSRSSGWELSGSVAWPIARHVALTGSGSWRRFQTKGPSMDWPIHENADNRKVTIGTRLSF